VPAALHSYDDFLRAAAANGFEKVEEIDVSDQAAPSSDYFSIRFERFRERLVADLGVTNEQIDALIASGVVYHDRYASGDYVYRVLQFRR
jgi:hypothetical protein